MLGLGSNLFRSPHVGFPNQYSLDFDGSNDYLDCGAQSSVWKNASALSIAGWFYIDAHKTTNGLIGKHENDNESTGIMMTNTDFYFLVSNGGGKQGACSVPTAAAWHHIACVFNGAGTGNAGRMQVYFDGVLQSLTFTGTIATTTSNSSTYGTNSVIIGDYQGDKDFDGKIDELGVWNTALTAAQALAIYNAKGRIDLKTVSGSNLKGYWRMGDGVLDSWSTTDAVKGGVVADQVNATISSEKFTAFANATSNGYASVTPTSTGFNNANIDNDGVGAVNTNQLWSDEAGKVAKISYTLTVNSGSDLPTIYWVSDRGGGSGVSGGNLGNATAGSNTIYRAVTNGTADYLEFYTSSGDTIDYSVSNFSVKIISGNAGLMTNMTTAGFVTEVPS